jgi:hypothetical protein
MTRMFDSRPQSFVRRSRDVRRHNKAVVIDKADMSFAERINSAVTSFQFSGPFTLFHAAKPPSIWQAQARLASWAACTAHS